MTSGPRFGLLTREFVNDYLPFYFFIGETSQVQSESVWTREEVSLPPVRTL